MGITIKGQAANGEQKKLAELCCEVSAKHNAPRHAVIALIIACIQESSMSNLNYGHSSSRGVLQLLDSTASGLGVSANDPAACMKLFLTRGFWGRGGAIHLAKTTGKPPGVIAQECQGSAFPDAYAPHVQEALKIMAAYGDGDFSDSGGGGSSSRTIKETKPYQFSRGKPGGPKNEDSWAAGQRLAGEVGWRFFLVRNRLYYMTEDDLIAQKSRHVLSETSDGVEKIDWSLDGGVDIDTATLECRSKLWQAPPGSVIELEGQGPADGRWLVTTVRRGLFGATTSIDLKRQAALLPEKAEPRNETTTRTIPGKQGGGGASDVRGGSKRQKIIEIAKRSLTSNSGHNRYSQAGALTDDPTPASARTDCSQWVYACYLQAGAGNPGTWTGDMGGRCRRTNNPKPGDILLNPASHVEMYVGGGKTIGHGSAPIDYSTVGYWKGQGFEFYALPGLD